MTNANRGFNYSLRFAALTSTDAPATHQMRHLTAFRLMDSPTWVCELTHSGRRPRDEDCGRGQTVDPVDQTGIASTMDRVPGAVMIRPTFRPEAANNWWNSASVRSLPLKLIIIAMS